jgi:UDP-N-acetylglucosamine acyltransferase
MPDIHPTALVDPAARLSADVVIGPYSVIGPGVALGPGTVVQHHASIGGRTTLGKDNRVFPFASLGSPPQDLKYRGEDTSLEVGDGNTFREFVTANTGTAGGGGVTRIGSGCLLMAYCHVAHDCVLGDGVIMANCATLAGHVTVHDRAIVGGLTAIHQFVRVGTLAMIGGASAVTMDVPPFVMASGNRAALHGLNLVGLKRQGVPEDEISRLKKAYRILFRSDLTLQEALARVDAEVTVSPRIAELTAFLRASERGVTR